MTIAKTAPCILSGWVAMGGLIVLCGCGPLSSLPGEKEATDVTSTDAVVWRPVGHGSGGTSVSVTIHPEDSDLVFVSNDASISYYTEDGGGVIPASGRGGHQCLRRTA